MYSMPQVDTGAVGKAIASDTRDPRFKPSHRQFYLLSTVLKTLLEKTKKVVSDGPFLKKVCHLNHSCSINF